MGCEGGGGMNIWGGVPTTVIRNACFGLRFGVKCHPKKVRQHFVKSDFAFHVYNL